MSRLDRAQCELARDEATQARAKAQSDLDEARAARVSAQAKHDEHRTPANRRTASDAREEVESCERILVQADEQLAKAKQAMEALERQEKGDERAKHMAVLEAYPEALLEGRKRLIALDIAVTEAGKASKRVVNRAIQAFLRVQELDAELGTAVAVREPTLADAILDAAKEATRARLQSGRQPYAPEWLAHVPHLVDWRNDGKTAADLEQDAVLAKAEAIRQQTVRDHAVVIKALATAPVLDEQPKPHGASS